MTTIQLCSLPSDVLAVVVEYLDPSDVLRCSCSCKALSMEWLHNSAWLPFCLRRWRHPLSWFLSRIVEYDVPSAKHLYQLLTRTSDAEGLWRRINPPRDDLIFVKKTGVLLCLICLIDCVILFKEILVAKILKLELSFPPVNTEVGETLFTINPFSGHVQISGSAARLIVIDDDFIVVKVGVFLAFM